MVKSLVSLLAVVAVSCTALADSNAYFGRGVETDYTNVARLNGTNYWPQTQTFPSMTITSVHMTAGYSAGNTVMVNGSGDLYTVSPSTFFVGDPSQIVTTAGTTSLKSGLVTTNLNNTGNLVLGASTNTPSLTLVQTNWIDGATYTNQTGRPILVTFPCKYSSVLSVGNASYSLKVNGAIVNAFGTQTIALGLAVSATNSVSYFIANGSTFGGTNTSSGGLNAAAVLSGGQYMVF